MIHCRRAVPWILGLSAALILCVWFVISLRRAAWQREAVEKLRRLGAVVAYDYQVDPSLPRASDFEDPGAALNDISIRRDLPDPDYDGLAWLRNIVGPDFLHDVVSVNLAYTHDADGQNREEPSRDFHEDILLLGRLPKLRCLMLIGNQANDRVLKAIQGLTQLEWVYLWEPNVTDDGIENMRSWTKLQYLHLSRCGITDRSLEVFGHLYDLEGLSLQGNRFTDEGLVHLGKLSRLRSLWLCESTIRGTGLEHLAALVELEHFGLQSCSLSDVGVQHLRPFTRLRTLALGKCDLTDLTVQAEAELREMFPDLQIDLRR